ncbi:MAG: COX15/CtaA family protein [Gammaproteobacteria bacterium]|jgi:heme a synthase|nr:COX15/CtaA family protein [Gammaproteobacteria bacterium]MBT4654788.1 COX15/CtaA family protein [Gammaproteobacteria bacterium]MBT5116827.1 COX15/CtaA family protein [Gammaproteobacteria bacterium]MBT6331108.1 COX15/CtaA family protein [Gammaproteobacteria bacterium]MBT7322485.1 COX15/CtaA family protein [Gammaproteobacteria bacterium]
MSLDTLRNICFFGALYTLVVISVGAWVRLTDAGLGCPDWPGCYGILGTPETDTEIMKAKELYPDASIDTGKAWREMFHRYLAGILGIFVFYISYLTIRYAKHVSIIFPIALSTLIIIQSIMGMLTVTELVKPTIVTTHLVLGMSTATLLLWNGLLIQGSKFLALIDKKLIILLILCITGLVIQIILGGWTSTNYASLACTDFPKCDNSWWPSNMDYQKGFTVFNLPDINYELAPLAYNAKVAIHFTHRFGALLLTALYLYLFAYIFFKQSNTTIKLISIIALLVFVLQIILGISNVIYSLPINIAVLHTVNASILLMSMITLLYYSTYHPQR